MITAILLYLLGMLIAWLITYIALLEDDHMKSAARTIFWPAYATALLVKVGFVAAKEISGK